MQINPILLAKIATLDHHVSRQINSRLDWISSAASLDGDRSTASLALVESRRQSEENAKVALARAEEGVPHGRATDADVEAARLALARERELTSQAQPEIAEIQGRAFASKTVFDGALRLLNSQKWPVKKKSVLDIQPTEIRRGRPQPSLGDDLPPNIEIVTPKMPEGDPKAIVATKRAEIDQYRDEIEDVEHAPSRTESAEAMLPVLVERLAARGAPVLDGAGEPKGTLKVDGPRIDIGAQPSATGSGAIPRPYDALALAAWLAPERVLEKLKADLHEAYVGIDVMLDPHEKIRRKRELKAAILRAERTECAALWALIEAGDDGVRFRPDTDPRAVLGIAVRA